MSLYILDTDTLQLLQDEHPRVIDRVQAVALDDRAISVISVMSELAGAAWMVICSASRIPDGG